jgi:hypothetical protein
LVLRERGDKDDKLDESMAGKTLSVLIDQSLGLDKEAHI